MHNKKSFLRRDPTFKHLSKINSKQIHSKLPWGYQWGLLSVVSLLLLAFYIASEERNLASLFPSIMQIPLAISVYIALGAKNNVYIDVEQRTYVEKKGLFPFIWTRKGSLDEMDTVEVCVMHPDVVDHILASFISWLSEGIGMTKGFSLIRLSGPKQTLLLEGKSPEDLRHTQKAQQLAQILKLPLHSEQTAYTVDEESEEKQKEKSLDSSKSKN